MLPTKTRKLSDLDQELDLHLQDSATRPRLQPPPSTDQDPPLTLYLFVQPPPEHPLPPPQSQLPPPPPEFDQDTELTIYFKLKDTTPPEQSQPDNNNNNNSNNPTPPRKRQNQTLTGQTLTLSTQTPTKTLTLSTQTPIKTVTTQTRNRASGPGKSPIVEPPFPWATDLRAKVHNLTYLKQNLIKTITGDVECKCCKKPTRVEFDLEQKFKEVCQFMESHRHDFFDRAPVEWMNPVLPACGFCNQENSMKPVVKKKKSINWLFLFLGQLLGCCTLAQLKYFCKHTGNHRTGAKDRVLYLTYVEMCKQVDPDRSFGDHR